MANTHDIPGQSPIAGLGDDAAVAAANLDRLVATQQQFNADLAISARQANQFGNALSTAFIGLAVQGKSVGDVLRSLALNLSKIAVTAAFKPLSSLLGNAVTGLVSGGLGGTQAFTSSGALAQPPGFPVTLGGGQDPSPARLSGAGLAHAPSPPAASSIVFNITTPDADSFRRSETQLAAMLSRAVAQGQRNL